MSYRESYGDLVTSASTISSTGNITAATTGGSSFLLFTGAAPVLQGLDSTGVVDGKQVRVLYTGSGTLTLANENASALAANRISCPTGADITLQPSEGAELVYASSRWKLIQGQRAIYPGGNAYGAAISVGTTDSHNFNLLANNATRVSVQPVNAANADTVFSGSAGITVPTGNTAARPSSPTNGIVRYNSQTNNYEGYGNSTWQTMSVTGTPIVQGGNTLGATATIGTNDANSLVLRTNSTTRLTILSTGGSTFAGNMNAPNYGDLSVTVNASGAGVANITTTLPWDSSGGNYFCMLTYATTSLGGYYHIFVVKSEAGATPVLVSLAATGGLTLSIQNSAFTAGFVQLNIGGYAGTLVGSSLIFTVSGSTI